MAFAQRNPSLSDLLESINTLKDDHRTDHESLREQLALELDDVKNDIKVLNDNVHDVIELYQNMKGFGKIAKYIFVFLASGVAFFISVRGIFSH